MEERHVPYMDFQQSLPHFPFAAATRSNRTGPHDFQVWLSTRKRFDAKKWRGRWPGFTVSVKGWSELCARSRPFILSVKPRVRPIVESPLNPPLGF